MNFCSPRSDSLIASMASATVYCLFLPSGPSLTGSKVNEPVGMKLVDRRVPCGSLSQAGTSFRELLANSEGKGLFLRLLAFFVSLPLLSEKPSARPSSTVTAASNVHPNGVENGPW